MRARYRIESDFYDTIYDESNDIAFYLHFAKMIDGPILECGCGTGRVAIPLALAGYDVVGIDASPEMLDKARTKLNRIRRKHGRIVFKHADMRNFNLKKKFAACLIPFFTFHHLLTDDDQIGALESIRKHLRPHGLLVLTIFNPRLNRWPENVRVLDRVKPVKGGKLVRSFVQRIESDREVIRGKFFIDCVTKEGTNRRELGFVLRYLTLDEAEERIRSAGFVVDAVLGDYERNPFTPNSAVMIIVAHRR